MRSDMARRVVAEFFDTFWLVFDAAALGIHAVVVEERRVS